MGIFGLFSKIKTLVFIAIAIVVVVIIIRIFKWKNDIVNMLKTELHLADAVSKSRSASSDNSNSSGDLVSFLSKASRLVNFKDAINESVMNNSSENVARESIPKVEIGRDAIRRKNSKTSTYKREELCRKIFEDYFDDYFPTCRPKFLTNPETGHPLELDGYNAAKSLAFEHNGAQHSVYPNRFHKTREEFDKQQARDVFKKQRCAELSIDLIEIDYSVPENELEYYIHSELKRLGHKRASP